MIEYMENTWVIFRHLMMVENCQRLAVELEPGSSGLPCPRTDHSANATHPSTSCWANPFFSTNLFIRSVHALSVTTPQALSIQSFLDLPAMPYHLIVDDTINRGAWYNWVCTTHMRSSRVSKESFLNVWF